MQERHSSAPFQRTTRFETHVNNCLTFHRVKTNMLFHGQAGDLQGPSFVPYQVQCTFNDNNAWMKNKQRLQIYRSLGVQEQVVFFKNVLNLLTINWSLRIPTTICDIIRRLRLFVQDFKYLIAFVRRWNFYKTYCTNCTTYYIHPRYM